MFFVRSKKKKQILDRKTDDLNARLKKIPLTSYADENIKILENLFKDDISFKKRLIENAKNNSCKYYIAYCDGMIDNEIMNQHIIRPLIQSDIQPDKSRLLEDIVTQVLLINETETTGELKKIVESITYGDTILFADGADQALILNTKKFMLRSIAEPETEKTLNGPREGFNESMLTNVAMLRRKLRTSELKFRAYTFGKQTNTKACIAYIEGIAEKKNLDELYKRLNKINIDAALGSNVITELIKDNPLSPFRSAGYTERPDVIAAKLLEGRIAIILDGTPSVITLPYLFVENFQVNEDYYLNFYYSSFSRLLRMVGFFITILVPAVYVAIIAFHKEMLPTPLFMNIVAERMNVPLPGALEAFIMLIVFDILRETGMRMPTSAGQALSIVGALVVGQAAVEASLISSPMIIIVGITGITNLLVPKLNAPVIYIRLTFLLLATVFGLMGVFLGLTALIIHILNLKSLDIYQISFINEFKFQNIKDIFIRAPWSTMRTRPATLTNNKTRMDNRDD